MDVSDLAPETVDSIDRIARAYVDDRKTPGIAYGVVHGGRLLHAGGFGETGRDHRLPDRHSVFRIASMTKSFTAAAVLMLRDEGALALDEPVSTYVPAVADIALPTGDAPPLTLRLLLTMSAGFPTDDPWADRQESMTAEEFEALLRAGPRFAGVPGTDYRYSNLSYAIIGRAVSNVSGQSFQRFVTDRFLGPMGLQSSCFSSDEVAIEHLVIGHRRSGDDWSAVPFDRPGEFSPIGGLYSSVADLAIWISGFIDASRGSTVEDRHPLSAHSRREMQQAHRLSDVSTTTVDGAPHALAKAYGMGLTLERHTAWGDVVAHSGGYPGFGSNMRWHTASGFGIIALANATYAAPGIAAAAMLQEILGHGAARTRPPVAWPEIATMRAAVERLLVEWDDDVADDVFAMNMDLDQPRAERRQHVRNVRARLGDIDVTAPADEDRESPAALAWTVTGTGGAVRIEMSLSPEPSPKIQSLDVRFVEPAPTAERP